jgi:hypothetical protein
MATLEGRVVAAAAVAAAAPIILMSCRLLMPFSFIAFSLVVPVHRVDELVLRRL